MKTSLFKSFHPDHKTAVLPLQQLYQFFITAEESEHMSWFRILFDILFHRSGKTIDKLFVLKNCQDGPVNSILREARKHDVIVSFVAKERLDQLSETGAHQGVIAQVAAYEYASVEDILAKAKEKGEDPFIFILDNIEDPHN